ncbi:Alpha/Beta hydrolase protein [Ampelomyces quisqualis]|uniref:Alpha/Beta hydrolase protein n=1 Tax=Ampelomyces quisqualis TaxID=50730 RepID=A0A6A5QAT6_AMPQU|nr:Alpha/Beta hydrolase protein [Ampelomyces quisqualis]
MAAPSEHAEHAARGPQQASEQGAQPGRISRWFPLSASEGFSQWWAGQSPMAAEHRVLSFIPHLLKPPTLAPAGSAPAADSLHDPYGPRRWHSQAVELGGSGRALNEFSVERVGEPVAENLVMLHGYGAGLAFFYRNFESLSRAEGWKVYALDLLGMGRSSRPSFKIHAKDKAGKIHEAESWFVDALEEWRIKRGLETFTLLGHSLGGYLAVAYALKYPGHLNKLILASPVGIPEDPYAVNDAMPDPQESTMANEFTQDASETAQPSPADSASPKDPPRRRLPAWLYYLWEANMISPFTFVRWSGPLGPRLVSGWTSRRFFMLPEEEAQALHDYSYALFRQRGSSEYALAYLLAPGAFARSPLIRRIAGVGRQPLPSSSSTPSTPTSPSQVLPPKKETGIPIIFMYGENDWMDVAGGFAAQEAIRNQRSRSLLAASEQERKNDRGECKVVIINKAGHHVYLDGWEQFNQVMREEMEDVRRRNKEFKG